MNNEEAANIRAIFADFKEKRIRFYNNIKKDVEEFDTFSISIERLIAYNIILRNIKMDGEDLKARVMKEIENMTKEYDLVN